MSFFQIFGMFIGAGILFSIAYWVSRAPLEWWVPVTDSENLKRLARRFLLGIIYAMAILMLANGLAALFLSK